MVGKAVSFAIAAGVCASVSVASGASSAESVSPEDARTYLRAAYPSVRFHEQGSRITRVYGPTFGSGDSPEETAESFRRDYADLFGVDPANLSPVSLLADGRHTQPIKYDRDTGLYAFTLVYYSQRQGGLPVFRAELRLLVRNEPGYPLVWVGSALRDLGGFPADVEVSQIPPGIGQAEALAEVPGLVDFSDPAPVIWAGVDDMTVTPAVAVTFVGRNDFPKKWLFVADAVTGEILYKENLIIDADMVGNVSGNSTEGVGAEQCEDEVPMPMPWARAGIQGGSTTFADENGDFVIPNSGSSPVTVESPVRGQWFRVYNWPASQPDTILYEYNVSPPGPVDFTHNATNTSELNRAEVNGYVHSNIVRDFTLYYSPGYPAVATETEFPVYVNRTDGYCPGNAWYDWDNTINFCQAGGGYPNTAWSSVIYHEYGHRLVAAAGSGQGAYGEGMGDVMSILILNDPRLGLGFFGDCINPLRNSDNNCQYQASGCSSCGSESHDCGRLLAGAVWDIRNELVITNPGTYIDIVSNLAINAMLMHTGSGIELDIPIDYLTLDDAPPAGDGNIGNGTPHWSEICTGFGVHNMDCPPLDIGMSVGPVSDFDSSGDVGGPFTPNSQIYTVQNISNYAISYTVSKSAAWVSLSNTSGTLDPQETAQVTVSINSSANSLPVGLYNDAVNFVNQTDHLGDTSRQVNLGVGIPDNCEQAMTICTGTYSDSTTDMTNDGSASCGSSSSSPDVWYRYIPATSGTLNVDTCGSSYDTVLSIHTGCPGTSGNEVACNDDDWDCDWFSLQSVVSASVTAGNTYYIRVSGWSGASGAYSLSLSGPDCSSGEPDNDPPTPDPMAFSAPPAGTSSSAISMTATLASDADSPPVQYQFDFVSGGSGGTDSAWQSARTYSDGGLSPNTPYSYRCRARDSASPPNATAYSPTASAYTLANTPAAPSLTNVTASTMDVNVNPNGNPASTTFAIQCSSTNPYDSTWNLKYVNASGNPGGTAVWRTDAQWGAITVFGLNGATQYSFRLKARNQDLVETAFGPAGSATTGECDSSADCDDGVACTVDTCEAGSCSNAPNDAFCDNDLFCDGEETCQTVLGCQDGMYPCGDMGCDEANDLCVDCVIDEDCDDGLFCNGAETCDTGACQPGGGSPCEPDDFCDEQNDICVAVDALMTCQLSSSEAPASSSVDLDLFLQDTQGLGSYQGRIAITRTSGSGEVTVSCPGGVEVDDSRLDWVFFGLSGVFTAADCNYLRIAAASPSACVYVGSVQRYLGTYHLNISADAEVGSTFEVTIIPDPYSYMRDCTADPIPFAISPVCTLTVTGPEMTCRLSSSEAPASGNVDLDLFLQDAQGLGSYQGRIAITRTSGSGEVTVGCPGGVEVDDSRLDWVFFGLPGVFTAADCANLRVTAASPSACVYVGSVQRYLGTYHLNISANAEVGSTFEVAIIPDPYSYMRDCTAAAILFAISPVCTLTVTEGCVEDSECDDGNDCTEDMCSPSNSESGPDGCVHDYRQRLFGDIVPLSCPPACPQPDVDDILCVLSDYGQGSVVNGCGSNDPPESTDLSPCGGNGVLDIDDIMAMLDAFSQVFACPHSCP